jgi:hypothetical protein
MAGSPPHLALALQLGATLGKMGLEKYLPQAPAKPKKK